MTRVINLSGRKSRHNFGRGINVFLTILKKIKVICLAKNKEKEIKGSFCLKKKKKRKTNFFFQNKIGHI